MQKQIVAAAIGAAALGVGAAAAGLAYAFDVDLDPREWFRDSGSDAVVEQMTPEQIDAEYGSLRPGEWKGPRYRLTEEESAEERRLMAEAFSND